MKSNGSMLDIFIGYKVEIQYEKHLTIHVTKRSFRFLRSFGFLSCTWNCAALAFSITMDISMLDMCIGNKRVILHKSIYYIWTQRSFAFLSCPLECVCSCACILRVKNFLFILHSPHLPEELTLPSLGCCSCVTCHLCRLKTKQYCWYLHH